MVLDIFSLVQCNIKSILRNNIDIKVDLKIFIMLRYSCSALDSGHHVFPKFTTILDEFHI